MKKSTTSTSRYLVGIDLGTTNCVVAYTEVLEDAISETGIPDPEKQYPPLLVLPVPQLTQPGSVEDRDQLPSFIYQTHEAELSEEDTRLPWSSDAGSLTGVVARHLGAKTPIRLIASAKSWLCHADVDCRSAILPVGSPEDVSKISPYDATIHYLRYLQDAWNYRFPDAPLAEQEVVITVPASFDPAARDLTVEAAKVTGLHKLTLLEEPQSAVYNWLQSHGNDWRKQVGPGDIIMVVDVGGGTTDLSLVAVTEDEGNLALNRIAVGDHILLGGDNMDLALAYRLKAKLASEGTELQPWQIQAIVHNCRDAKEELLGETALQSVPIAVPSRGSRLIGKTLRTELTRDEVQQTLVEGFFPQVGIDEHPRQQIRRALTQMSLPYAQDPAITRHLAAFLSRQVGAADELLGRAEEGFIKPTAILFNGGVLKSAILRDRLLTIINGWLSNAGSATAKLLTGSDLDLAVAKGAAYYNSVRQGSGVRIRGGIASAYYVGIESAMPAIPGMEAPLEALCVAPFGMEEGSRAAVQSQELGLVVGEPVRFKFFGSKSRRQDTAGTMLDYWEPGELEALPEIQATLADEGRKPGSVVPVRLESSVSELGTLRLEAVTRDGSARWQVEFDVRD
jgi:molecular chaperone DnaK (HSP70)